MKPTARRWNGFHLVLLVTLPFAVAAALVLRVPATLALLAWLIANVAVLVLGERIRPYRRDWHPEGAHLHRDGSVWSMNLLVDAGVGAALAALSIALSPGPNTWPFALQVLVGLATAEFGSYWLHRWSHSGGWLWRVHLLHHRPGRLNVANALTAHPFNATYDKAARLLPMLLLGLSPEALLAVAMFGLTQALAVHANIAGTLGFLDRWIGSAELHRLHHSTEPDDAGNFGTHLTLWDRVFRTYRHGREPAAVGVFAPGGYPGELQLRDLLLWPLESLRPGWRLHCCGVHR